MTGADTSPTTLATALGVLQTSLTSLTSTNTTIDNLATVIVSFTLTGSFALSIQQRQLLSISCGCLYCCMV